MDFMILVGPLQLRTFCHSVSQCSSSVLPLPSLCPDSLAQAEELYRKLFIEGLANCSSNKRQKMQRKKKRIIISRTSKLHFQGFQRLTINVLKPQSYVPWLTSQEHHPDFPPCLQVKFLGQLLQALKKAKSPKWCCCSHPELGQPQEGSAMCLLLHNWM